MAPAQAVTLGSSHDDHDPPRSRPVRIPHRGGTPEGGPSRLVRPAAGLEWSCYDTAVHIGSDFAAYAAQLTGRAAGAYVPFEISADPGTTPEGLIEIIEATGGLLSAAVAVARPGDRAWHPYGMAGGDGFAAMGVVETLLHTHDILGALGTHDWEPDSGCASRSSTGSSRRRRAPPAPRGRSCCG